MSNDRVQTGAGLVEDALAEIARSAAESHEFPHCVQDGATAPRGFTLLCRSLGARVTEVASAVSGLAVTLAWTGQEAVRLQRPFADLER